MTGAVSALRQRVIRRFQMPSQGVQLIPQRLGVDDESLARHHAHLAFERRATAARLHGVEAWTAGGMSQLKTSRWIFLSPVDCRFHITTYLPALRTVPSGALALNVPTSYAQSPLSSTSRMSTRTVFPPD